MRLLSAAESRFPPHEYRRIIKHCACSGAILRDPRYHMDMVRAGLVLYGYAPSPELSGVLPLQKAMTVSARIVQIARFNADDLIGYGNNHRLKRDSVLAVIRAGYGDGLPRALSNRGAVRVRGEICPVVGNICMDLSIIDVTNVTNLFYTDYAYLIDDVLDADEVARRAGTISYEIMTAFSRRIERIYTGR